MKTSKSTLFHMQQFFRCAGTGLSFGCHTFKVLIDKSISSTTMHWLEEIKFILSIQDPQVTCPRLRQSSLCHTAACLQLLRWVRRKRTEHNSWKDEVVFFLKRPHSLLPRGLPLQSFLLGIQNPLKLASEKGIVTGLKYQVSWHKLNPFNFKSMFT